MLTAAKWTPGQSRNKIGEFGSGHDSAKTKPSDSKSEPGEKKTQERGLTPRRHQNFNPVNEGKSKGKRGAKARRTRKAYEMDNMRLFAQITKVDEAKRLVYTRVVDETPDKADERFDYAKSKPFFEAWSKNQFDASGGKSYGNVRAMHGKSVAGIIPEPLSFNDSTAAIDAVIKVIDNNDWEKVLAGGYTGASIGGSYVGDKVDEKIGDRTIKRYVANPVEISLVDSPCVPTARFFDIVKADGTTNKVAFKPPEYEVVGTDEQVRDMARLMKANSVGMEEIVGWLKDFETAKAVDAMLETIEEMAKREFNADERKAAAKAGHALPDGSFPINTVSDLHNAVQAYGRAKDKAAAKAHIMKRAKALGAMDALPDSWTKEKSDKVYGKDKLSKGMYSLSSMADCLSCLAGIARQCEDEDEWEDDNSDVPAKLRNLVDDAIAVFKDMTEEETEELLAELKEHAEVGPNDEIEMAMAQALTVGALRKKLTDPNLPVVELAKICDEHKEPLTPATMADMPTLIKRLLIKAGARHSKIDAQHLQAAHDHLVDMGADCDSSDAGKARVAENLAKGANALSDLQTKVAELTSQVEVFRKQPVPYVTLRAVPRTAPVEKTDAPVGTEIEDKVKALLG